MAKVKYSWGSMLGTFDVDCDIIRKEPDGDFTIKFVNPVSNQMEQRTVHTFDITFPKFADLVM